MHVHDYCPQFLAKAAKDQNCRQLYYLIKLDCLFALFFLSNVIILLKKYSSFYFQKILVENK